VKPLFPVFSHPRSRPSGPAAQQLKFCSLARSLLQQATLSTNPTVARLTTVLPSPHEDDTTFSPEPPHAQKYALMQKLPGGEWWTSLNSQALDASELKDVPLGHAELVAILPTPVESLESVPTLAHYMRPSVSALSKRSQSKLPAGRRLSTGAFLDYGPHASFAPTFDQEGAEVGSVALAEVLWWEERKRRLEAQLGSMPRGRQGILPPDGWDATEDADMEDVQEVPGPSVSSSANKEHSLTNGDIDMEQDPADLLEGLLPEEQIASLKSALDDLELEEAVQELLDRTSRAISRLEALQLERLGGPDGGSSTVDPESEEFTLGKRCRAIISRSDH